MSNPLYITGDATCPSQKRSIIAHICNDIGGWGRGFVLALSQRWPQPEAAYRQWHASGSPPFELGAVQIVGVDDDRWVANMIAQHGVRATASGPPIRYAALATCLRSLARSAQELEASVHMPRIGCGLAGGSWDRVEPLIEDTLVAAGVAVHVYDLPAPASPRQ